MASKPPHVPAKVRVLGRDFTMVPAPQMIDATGNAGLCDLRRLRITYDPQQEMVELQDTIVHEVTHAIDFLMDLDLTEKQVRGIATGLISVIRDNPQFAKLITF